jgi:hypothetical protein
MKINNLITGALASMIGYLPHLLRPEHTSKHRKGRRRPKNWAANRKIRRQMAKASRKINRQK